MNTDKTYAEAIASEYAPKGTSKLIALKKLDRRAKRPATVFVYVVGIAMTLVFGLGMCFAMHVIGGDSVGTTVLGIVIGGIGMVGIGVNYPIYTKLLESGKKKYAFEIMELAREISEHAE